AVGTIDYIRGFAMHHVVAAAVPIRSIANYFINSPAARFLGGTARNFEARMYALDVKVGLPITYHIGARADLADGALRIQGLAQPLERLHGVIRIFDGGLSARSLDATLAGAPLRLAGGIYNFSNPQFYFGVQGTAGLESLKVLMPFAQHYPVTGSMRLETLIEGPIAGPLVLIGFSSPLARYQGIPVHDLRGVAALYDNAVSIVPLRARYGGVDVTAHGQLLLGKAVSSDVAVHFATQSDDVPYLGSMAPHTPIVGDAILRGNDQYIGADGYLANAYRATALNGLYNVTPRGYSTFGPISIATGNGTLYGALVVDRPRGDSAFWLSADHFPLALAREAALPGVKVPTLPPLQGSLDSVNLAGGGSQNNVVLAGRVRASHAQIRGVPIDTVEASLAGPLANLAIPSVNVRAPWGTFEGNGDYAPNGLIARGTYDGRLESLSRFLPVSARGGAHGVVALAVGGNGITVQAQDLHLSGAQIRGFPVEAASGTLAIAGNSVRVYSARATVGGADTVAAGTFGSGGQLALEAVNAGPQTAAALGLPLQAGRVSVSGTLGGSTAAPTFAGGVALSSGRVAGYPISGTSEVNLNGDAVQLSNATLTTAGMYGAVAGTIGGIRSGSPSYDLNANVPAGDIASIAQALHLPTYGTSGSFGANVRIGGAGAAPVVQGPFTVAAGQINGLNFGNAAALLTADPNGVSVRSGRVDVGTTSAAFDASVGGGRSYVSLNAPRADLTDFNDYFDTGDTLAGKGSVAVAFVHSSRAISSSGNVNVRDFRYRRLPIGDTQAHWSSRNDVAQGQLRVGGEHGTLAASGSVALAPATSGIRQIVTNSRYNLSAHLRSLDLGTWLAALGYPTLPVTGRLNGDATFNGRYPNLSLRTTADLHNGTFGRVPIDRLSLAAHAAGSRVALSQINVNIPALAASGSGSFGFGARDPIAFDMRASSSNLPMFLSNFTHASLPVTGALETTLRVRGRFGAPTLTAGVNFTKGVIRGVAVPELVAEVSYAGRDILLRSAELTLQKGQITIAGALPFEVSPLQIGPPNAPFSMDLFSRGVDVSDFQSLFPSGTTISGLVDGRVGISGQVARPQIRGRLSLQNGSYVSDFETMPITHTVAELTFAQTSATLTGVHAQVGSGTLDASGRISFALQRPAEYTLDAVTKRAGLRFPAYGSGTLDSKIHLVKTTGLAKVSGTATVSDAVIPFATLIRGGGGGGDNGGGDNSGGGLPFNLAFDNFSVTAAKNVAVRANALGFGIDIGAHGNALLGGTLEQPTLAGRFDSTGGTLTFVDHAFKIREGNVVFDPHSGIVPELYAVGTTHVLNPDPNAARNPSGSADITITVTGPATNP
ncbi:MAG: translocation/assembly module TamB domain-containing protein, partial [Candidatus Eremiobacteraeota bacterium]|nr:translocation/assembly module TamB domain-containing protein [Candidatus Eremiobacteraeota bacterium]